MQSFESTKSEILASGLGKALGLAASHTWAQIVATLKGVVNRGTLNWSGNNTTYSVPAGYYSNGTLDSRPSYTNGYNAGVTAGKAEMDLINAKVLLQYDTVAGVTETLTCPDCKAAIGIAVVKCNYNKKQSVSTSSGNTPVYITNADMEKAMYVRLSPGNTISAYTGSSESNSRRFGLVAIVYI